MALRDSLKRGKVLERKEESKILSRNVFSLIVIRSCYVALGGSLFSYR